ncbi:MAG: hypothetical protein AAFR17_07570 [Pseudomonadota bacterium]
MPLDNDAIDELKSLIAVSRKRDLNFGLCLGKKPEDTALVMHRIKGPEMLQRSAKKMDGVLPAKSSFGTLRTKGKIVTLSCQSDPPQGGAKRLRIFFREINLPMRVILLGPDGAVFEEDGEEEDNAPEAVAATDPNQAKWEAARSQAEPKILAFLKAGEGDVSKVRAAWSYACGNADEGDYLGALKVLTRLLKLLTAAGPTPEVAEAPAQTAPVDPAAKATITELLKTLKQDLARMENASGPEVDALKARFAEGVSAAKSGDFASAQAILLDCTDLSAAASRALRTQEAAAAVPEGKVAAIVSKFEAQIAQWRTGRLRSIAGLGALITKLKRSDDDELHQIAQRIDTLRKDLPDALEASLTQFTSALARADLETAKSAKSAALGQVAQAAAFLKDNRRELGLCEANPFDDVDVEVLAPLSQALTEINGSLRRL